MTSLRLLVTVILAGGVAACPGPSEADLNPVGPTNPGGTSVLVGSWAASVATNNQILHESCTITGTLVISQTGTGTSAKLKGDFTGVQSCAGQAGNSQDNVVGPIDNFSISGRNISFVDGLGLTYVGTLDSATNPTKATGTASGTLTTQGNTIIQNGTWTLTR